MNDESRVRAAAFRITAHFEGSGYASYQNIDSGIVSYGRFQFTLASGMLRQIVDQFVAQSTTLTASQLRAYQGRIVARDASLRRDQTFRDLLIAAADEPVMQHIQDEVATTHYWEPIKRVAIEPRGLTTPLAWALLFDIGIHFGVGDGFLRIAERQFGVPERSYVSVNGLSEAELITRVAELRKQSHDRQAIRDNLPGLRVRGDFWLNLVQRGDWHLQGDLNGNIIVKGTPIPVRTPNGKTPDSGELDPNKFYIMATADRIRLRQQPVSGETIGVISEGQILEVIEPYSTAVGKLGIKNQWLQVQQADGARGYTAAWFYTIYQKPTVPEAPPDTKTYFVTPTSDRIRIRAQAVDGAILGFASRGDVLQVLDSAAELQSKIGVQGQWLRVRLANGTEGYTAAWFYTIYQNDTAPDTTPPKPDSLLFITPTADRIRVRAQPVNGESLGFVSRGDVIQALDPADEVRRKIGVHGQWLHVRLADQVEGHTAAWFYTIYDASAHIAGESQAQTADQPVHDDTTLPQQAETALIVSPTEDRVRVRAKPDDGEPISLVSRGDVLRSLEPRQSALKKLGKQGQWLYVRTRDGEEGYAAAHFFTPVRHALPERTIEANITGVNLDRFHPLGTPPPTLLGQTGWVRLKYDVAFNPEKAEDDPARYQNTDLDFTYGLYQPVLEQYAQAGIKVILALNHQTYAGSDITGWNELTLRFSQIAGRIAAQYRAQNIVCAYQVWDGMDDSNNPTTAIPPEAYASLLTQSMRAIRASDPEPFVITGGHVSDIAVGVQYIRRALQLMPADTRPDGLAIHAYGRGAAQSNPRFRSRGYIDDQINAFAAVMPGWPVWITEWGIQNAADESPEAVARYTREFVGRINELYSHKVAAALWNPWHQSPGTDGYGLVDEQGEPRSALLNTFVNL